MQDFIKLFTMSIIGLLLNSCSSSQKIELMKPEPTEAAPIKYPITSSYISFPINLSLKDIEKQTNKALQGLIYNDSILDDDNTEVKIWKNGEIKITEENQKVKSIVPLKIWAKVKYGTSALGLNLYDIREFNLNGNVTLLSDVHMQNWKVTSTTSLQDIEWNESPSVKIAGKEIAITYLINPTIRIFRSKIEKLINESMNKSLDFKSNVLDFVQKVADPIEMSANYQTWLKVTPLELYATEATLQKNAVSVLVGLKCNMESYIGAKPLPSYDRNKIALKTIANLPDKINANIVALSSYQDASRIMTQNFKGQEFSSGKRKVIINQVDIWHKNGKMIIALDMSGSLNGRIYLSGFPQYNPQTKELYFDDLDYALETKSKLMKTANWLFQGLILTKIKASCKYSIEPNLQEGNKNIAKYLNNYSPMTGVFVNGKMNEILFDKVQLTNQGILAFLNVSGKIKVTINGMQ